MTKPSPVDELLTEIRELTVASHETAEALHAVRARLRRHVVALIVGGVGLLLDLVLSVLVVFLFVGQGDYNARQDCVNTRTANFLAAERAKVAGQVAGVIELRNAKTKAQAADGIDRFVRSSERYLATIAKAQDCKAPE
jgi:hypothetical protein